MRKLRQGMKIVARIPIRYISILSYFSGVTSAFNFLICSWEKIWDFKTYFLLYWIPCLKWYIWSIL